MSRPHIALEIDEMPEILDYVITPEGQKIIYITNKIDRHHIVRLKLMGLT